MGLALTVGRGFGFGRDDTVGLGLGVGIADPPTGGVGRDPVGRAAGPGVVFDAMTGGVGAAALGPVVEPVRHQRPLLLSFAQRST